MKRLLLAFCLCFLTSPAWAVCPITNLTVKDAAASPVTALVPYADDGSGGSNCSPQIQIKQGGNVATVGTYGTAPGAVGALNVNASVTNANANGQATMANSSPVAIASNQSAVPMSPQAIASGGATPYTPFVPAASDNHQTVKNGAGTAYSVSVTNNSATKNYLRLYDAGTGFNGCASATGVIFAMEIPPTDSGFSVPLGGAVGLSFSTGLSLCVTSGFGLTDTTAATATAMYVNVAYK